MSLVPGMPRKHKTGLDVILVRKGTIPLITESSARVVETPSLAANYAVWTTKTK